MAKNPIGIWIAKGNYGASSMTMASVFLGAKPTEINYPHDPSDFRRCYELVQCYKYPGAQLTKMRGISKEWTAIVEYWYELVALYEEEKDQYRAPKLYDFMKKLYENIK